MKLYEISKEMYEAIERYNSVTSDEDLAAVEKDLEAIQLAFNEKILSVGYFIRNLDADINAIENELKRLSAMREKVRKQRDWLKSYMFAHMKATQTEKVESSTIKMSIRKDPPSVVVTNIDEVPEEYKRKIEETVIDKRKILEDWKEGVGVAGTTVEQKERLDIR